MSEQQLPNEMPEIIDTQVPHVNSGEAVANQQFDAIRNMVKEEISIAMQEMMSGFFPMMMKGMMNQKPKKEEKPAVILSPNNPERQRINEKFRMGIGQQKAKSLSFSRGIR